MMKSNRSWAFVAALALLSFGVAVDSCRKKEERSSAQAQGSMEEGRLQATGSGEPSKGSVPSSPLPIQQEQTSTPKSRQLAAQAGTPSANDLKTFLQNADPQASWSLNRSATGRIIAVSGGLIRADLSTDKKALAFARQMAALLGTPAEQIEKSSSPLQPTPDTESFRFDQVVNGYAVWGSDFQVHIRKRDRAIYYITNETQDVKDVDTTIARSLAQAVQHLKDALMKGQKFIVESESEQPVIIADEQGKWHLCWQIQVKVTELRFDRKFLFLSVSTLELVRSVRAVIKD